MIESEYKNHTIWATIKTLQDSLGSFSDLSKADERHAASQKLVAFTQWVLMESEPWLVSANELEQSNSELMQARNYLDNCRVDWSYYNYFSQSFSPLFHRFGVPRKQRFSKAEASGMLSTLSKEISDAKLTLQSLKKAVAEERSSIQASAQGWEETRHSIQRDFQLKTEALDSAILKMEADLRKTADLASSGVEEAKDALQKSLAAHLAGADEKIEGKIQQFNSSFLTAVDDFDKLTDSKIKEVKSDLESALGEAQSTLSNITEIYAMAGDALLAGGFVEAHAEENNRYKWMSIFAVSYLILGVLVLGFFWWSYLSKISLDMSNVLARVSISFIVMMPGFYLASLANRHRISSVALRSLGLRIKAFDAYISNAPEAQRNDLRSQLAQAFFIEPMTQGKQGLFLGARSIDRTIAVVDKALDKIPTGKVQ